MGIEIEVSCSECGHKLDESEIICPCCYQSLKNEIAGLEQTIRELEELQSGE